MIKQHVVDIRGNVVEAKNMTDLEVMGLIYNVKRTTRLPYETKKSLKQILFENKDKSLEKQEVVITGFFSQLGYKVLSVESLNITDLLVTIRINKENTISLVL